MNKSTQHLSKSMNKGEFLKEPFYRDFGDIISDAEALKIHGLDCDNDDYSTNSDSGKSSLDEEYYKNKPQPLVLSRNNIVVIEPEGEVKTKHGTLPMHDASSATNFKKINPNPYIDNFAFDENMLPKNVKQLPCQIAKGGSDTLKRNPYMPQRVVSQHSVYQIKQDKISRQPLNAQDLRPVVYQNEPSNKQKTVQTTTWKPKVSDTYSKCCSSTSRSMEYNQKPGIKTTVVHIPVRNCNNKNLTNDQLPQRVEHPTTMYPQRQPYRDIYSPKYRSISTYKSEREPPQVPRSSYGSKQFTTHVPIQNLTQHNQSAFSNPTGVSRNISEQTNIIEDASDEHQNTCQKFVDIICCRYN